MMMNKYDNSEESFHHSEYKYKIFKHTCHQKIKRLVTLTQYIGSYTFLLMINSGLLKFVFKQMHM